MISGFQKPTGIIYCFVILFIAVGILTAVHAAEKTESPSSVPVKAETPAPEKDLTGLIPHVTKLSQRFTDLQRQIEGVFGTSEIQEELIDLSEKLEDLSWDITFLKYAGHHSYDELAYYKKELSWRSSAIKEIRKPLDDAVKLITAWKSEWTKEQKQLAEWHAVVEAEGAAQGEKKAFETYKETTDSAIQLIAQQLTPLLAADQKAGDLQVKVHALGLEIDMKIKALQKAGFQKTFPSMISSDYVSQFNRELWVVAWRGVSAAAHLRIVSSQIGGWVLFPVIAVFAIMTLFIYRSGRFLTEDAKWRLFSRRPAATSLLICAPLVTSFVVNLPPAWLTAIQIITLIAALRLARGLLLGAWKKRIFTQVAVLLLITGVLSMIGLPLALFRLFVLFLSSIGLVFCLWHGWRHHRSSEPSPVVWALRLGALVLLCVLIAEISGYATFAFFLFNASLRTVLLAVIVWVLFLVTSGAVEMAFYKFPAPIIQRNASALVGRLTPLLIFFFTVVSVASFLVIWRLYTTEWEAAQGLFSLGFDMGSQRITLGLILSIFGVLYGAVLASWAIQAVLLQEVLPRSKVESGVQFSIARLVHYAIVTLGFLMALHVLGFGLTNLTILGGALGVGIGFGLQAIVNNFASGLILLFERPIKVGDTIEINGQMGEVRNLGLRATVIRTYDSAEIVVPNSDLITGQLTNWTLEERRIRLKLPVGVAYGSDVARVMGLLMSCANENMLVLKDPSPRVLFLSFGASSLDFELRIWIGEFTDRRKVQSDLNEAIDLKFRKAGIEIPFPQQDLYLRSLPESFKAAPK